MSEISLYGNNDGTYSIRKSKREKKKQRENRKIDKHETKTQQYMFDKNQDQLPFFQRDHVRIGLFLLVKDIASLFMDIYATTSLQDFLEALIQVKPLQIEKKIEGIFDNILLRVVKSFYLGQKDLFLGPISILLDTDEMIGLEDLDIKIDEDEKQKIEDEKVDLKNQMKQGSLKKPLNKYDEMKNNFIFNPKIVSFYKKNIPVILKKYQGVWDRFQTGKVILQYGSLLLMDLLIIFGKYIEFILLYRLITGFGYVFVESIQVYYQLRMSLFDVKMTKYVSIGLNIIQTALVFYCIVNIK